MKLILLILLNLTIYTQTNDLNGFWELVDYNDGKAKYSLRTGAFSEGLFFTDSTIHFFENIYFSNLLSEKYIRTKEYKEKYSGNYFNKRNFTISNNKLFLPLYGNDLLTELRIERVSEDTLILRNEVLDYEHIYKRRVYSESEPIRFSKITFSTSYCLGDCPVYNLEIDSTGFVKFEGIDHILYLGKYEYRLHDSIYSELKKLVNIVNWETLDNHYFGIMHGPTLKTKILCKDTVFKEVKDHTGPVTCELKWFYNFIYRIAKLPFKQKILEYNIFRDKTLKIKKISKSKNLTGYHLLDNKDNDYILSKLLKTESSSNSFVTKYYIEAYELIWDDIEQKLLEKEVGTIESDGLYFKLNNEVYKCISEDLDEYFESITNEN